VSQSFWNDRHFAVPRGFRGREATKSKEAARQYPAASRHLRGTQMPCLLISATQKRVCDNGTRISIAAGYVNRRLQTPYTPATDVSISLQRPLQTSKSVLLKWRRFGTAPFCAIRKRHRNPADLAPCICLSKVVREVAPFDRPKKSGARSRTIRSNCWPER